MNISIKSYQTSIPAKAPAQEGLRSENTTKSTTENTNSSTAATVSISLFKSLTQNAANPQVRASAHRASVREALPGNAHRR